MKYDRGEIRNFRKSERFWEFGHSEVEIATTIENPIIDFLVPIFRLCWDYAVQNGRKYDFFLFFEKTHIHFQHIFVTQASICSDKGGKNLN